MLSQQNIFTKLKPCLFVKVGTITQDEVYIGLDDLMIKSRCRNPSNILPSTIRPTLPPGVTTPTPNPNNAQFFKCSGGYTIPSSKLCDYHKDCPEGDDERNCGSCNFYQHDMCRYTIQSES